MNADITAVLSAKIYFAEKYICKQSVNIRKKFGKKSVPIDVIVKENDKAPAKLNTEGGENSVSTPLSEQQKESILHKFDSYCKKVLKGTAINYDRKRNYLTEHEISMSDLPDNLFAMSHTDSYFQQNHYFEMSTGETIVVKDDAIARGIILLPVVQREIILLSYFTNMTDNEISKKLDIPRSTVQYKRAGALELLKEILEEQK